VPPQTPQPGIAPNDGRGTVPRPGMPPSLIQPPGNFSGPFDPRAMMMANIRNPAIPGMQVLKLDYDSVISMASIYIVV